MTELLDSPLQEILKEEVEDKSKDIPKDEPKVDPMVSLEITLEDQMLVIGRDHYLTSQKRVTDQGQRASTKAGGRIVAGGVERISRKLTEWIEARWAKLGKGGRKPAELLVLSTIDKDRASAVAMRSVLNCMSQKQKYPRTCLSIGRAVEQELKNLNIKKVNPKMYAFVLKTSKKLRNRVKQARVGRAAQLIGANTNRWSNALAIRVGAVLLICIQKATGVVEIQHTRRPNSKLADLYVVGNHGIFTWIKQFDEEQSLMRPALMPMVIPPRPWTGPDTGGYITPKLQHSLVKNGRKEYLKELASWPMPEVYAAINTVQSTAWQVNAEVYNVFTSILSGNGGIAGIPLCNDAPFPPAPADAATNPESLKTWKRLMRGLRERNRADMGKRIQMSQLLAVAKTYVQYPAIYMPHVLDFRGRVYALPNHLQPQGCDAARGLLRFAEGKELSTPEAVRWFKIHGANCAGVDKVSFDDRVAWVDAFAHRIIGCAADPIAYQWWAEQDSPWQFLAWCMEYAQWVSNPDTFKSHLPVALDGSCSGLQHFGAMLRDPVGAEFVNLAPSPKPKDIYGKVAEVTLGKLQVLASGNSLQIGNTYTSPWDVVNVKRFNKAIQPIDFYEAANLWHNWGYVDRKLTKRNVMTQPYGATLMSHRGFVQDRVYELMDKGTPAPFHPNYRLEMCLFLSRLIWDAIGEVVQSARVAMDWLQEAASGVVSKGLPVTWVSPSNFPIRQGYLNVKPLTLELSLGDKIQKVRTFNEVPLQYDQKRQRSGIAPNFVHSCDAAALVKAVNLAKSKGINTMSVIHDSFATHAADTQQFAACIRESFVRMYEDCDPLADFAKNLKEQGVETTPPPAKGTFDLREILTSDYCFS